LPSNPCSSLPEGCAPLGPLKVTRVVNFCAGETVAITALSRTKAQTLFRQTSLSINPPCRLTKPITRLYVGARNNVTLEAQISIVTWCRTRIGLAFGVRALLVAAGEQEDIRPFFA